MIENTEVKEVSVIETALVKANVTQQIISKLKTDYMSLKINGIEDKEGFKKMDAGRKEAKKLRCLAVNICEEGRENAVKVQRDWLAKQKEVVKDISEVEDYCEKECDKILEEEKRILFEAAQQAKLPFRKNKLMTIGTEIEEGCNCNLKENKLLKKHRS